MKKTIKVVRTILFAFVFFCLFLPTIKAQEYIKISLTNGTSMEIPLSEIQKLGFDNVITFIPEQQVLIAKMMMKVYPNPASELVNISYTLKEKGNVIIKIYNNTGALVYEITQGKQTEGEYNCQWNTTNVPSGTYICKVQQNNTQTVTKIIINK